MPNLFLADLTGRADWKSMMQRFRASEFDSLRLQMLYDIDPSRRLVIWTHTSSELAGVWTHTLETILADPRFTTGFNILEDLRDDLELPAAPDVQKGVSTIRFHHEVLGACRWAVVVRRDSPAFYGMLRMAAMLLEGTSIDLRPFMEMSEALEWLETGADLIT